jgi:hypothetical protein
MFQAISGIDIGQGAGRAFGGGIYAASCQIGFSSGPTKITLNVASESGIYQSLQPNVTTPYNVNMNGNVFSGMYLVSYEKNKSPDSALLTLSFADSSIVLDKIFVGLLHRHGNTYKRTQLVTGTFTVRCPTCTDGIITGLSGTARRYIDDIPINSGTYFEKNADGGGFIILGKENFPENNCEIPRVDYNFSELCHALSVYGLKHNLSSFDLNPLYRQEYIGTLREVLNQWAGDFAFEFFFEGNTLKAIDLRQQISLTGVQSFADTSEFVTNSAQSETLENTYTQTVIARYLKPSTVREYTNTFNFKEAATPISLSDIVTAGTCAGRNGDTLLTSVALARLDPALREAYIANYAIENNTLGVLQALGFQNDSFLSILTPSAAASILYNSKFWDNIDVAASIRPNEKNYAVVVGLYREDIKGQIDSWDQEAANNFLGKYYRFNVNLPTNQFNCPFSADWFIYYTYDSKWETVPSSDIRGGDALPFASLLRDPSANTNLTTFSSKNIFSVEDNAWGLEQTVYDADKGTQNYELWKPQIMTFEEFPVPGYSMMDVMQNASPTAGIPINIQNLFAHPADIQGAKPAFVIIPLFSKMPSIAPKISPVNYRTFNRAVYDRQRSRTSNDEKAPTCITYCDSNIVSEICNCGAQYTPVPYFQNLMAPYVLVSHPNGKTSTVTFPVDSNYFGYFVHNRYFKTTYPPVKSIYGTPPAAASNTLSTRVLDYDITPDIDAIVDNNDAVNQFLYSPTNQQIVTAQSYYNSLANMNNMVVPSQKTIKLSVARTDLASLGLNLTPSNGLIDITLSLADGGVQTDLTFATRPKSIPKPEAVFTKIKYRLRPR